MHHAVLAAIVLFAVVLFLFRSGDTYEETNIYEEEPAPRRNRVTLSVGDAEGSMRPTKARKLARELLEKADEAEEDGE